MSHDLTWEKSSSALLLSGTLGRDSLLVFWEKRKSLLAEVEQIDVSGLEHVDSTGLSNASAPKRRIGNRKTLTEDSRYE